MDGGVFQEGSKLSDADGYRKGVVQASKDLNIGLLRWPGGGLFVELPLEGRDWAQGPAAASSGNGVGDVGRSSAVVGFCNSAEADCGGVFELWAWD